MDGADGSATSHNGRAKLMSVEQCRARMEYSRRMIRAVHKGTTGPAGINFNYRKTVARCLTLRPHACYAPGSRSPRDVPGTERSFSRSLSSPAGMRRISQGESRLPMLHEASIGTGNIKRISGSSVKQITEEIALVTADGSCERYERTKAGRSHCTPSPWEIKTHDIPHRPHTRFGINYQNGGGKSHFFFSSR